MEGSATVLAFDFGRKRIGVAVGQQLGATSQPLDTVAVIHNKPDWDHIGRLLGEWQPDRLLVGLPLNMDGSEHDLSRAARRFANQLQGRYRRPVELVDERLSSIEAEAIVDESRRRGHVKQGQRKRAIDPVAAELILRTWLAEQQRQPGMD